MSRISIFSLFLFAMLAACTNKAGNTAKTDTTVASRHSAAFNQSVESALGSYYSLTEAFVKWDSAGIPSLAIALRQKLDSLSLKELKKEDSTRANDLLRKAGQSFASLETNNSLA